ncbi:MAG: hypothetical protein CL521_02100, partial [Actinobacteria bacterium]|nr:hypothetical protein [Actinomycetota bacterium]
MVPAFLPKSNRFQQALLIPFFVILSLFIILLFSLLLIMGNRHSQQQQQQHLLAHTQAINIQFQSKINRLEQFHYLIPSLKFKSAAKLQRLIEPLIQNEFNWDHAQVWTDLSDFQQSVPISAWPELSFFELSVPEHRIIYYEHTGELRALLLTVSSHQYKGQWFPVIIGVPIDAQFFKQISLPTQVY